MSVRIVTDSACDLSPELCRELGVEVVPLTIRFGEEEFVDRRDLTSEQFWSKLPTASVLPETAAPSVGAFEEAFRSLVDGGADGIVCINLSSAMSATLQSAQLAAKAFDGDCNIAMIDSKSASMGIGLHVVHAARLAQAGADLATIVEATERNVERSHLLFTVDTLDYLRKGGRISGAQALVGTMLSIKPIIGVDNGAVVAQGKVRTRSKALRHLVDKVKETAVAQICVLHSNAPDLDEFIAMLEPIAPSGDIVVGCIGPVVGVHVGPGAIGVVWVERAA
jgi:DegV family protein with EDD domain